MAQLEATSSVRIRRDQAAAGAPLAAAETAAVVDAAEVVEAAAGAVVEGAEGAEPHYEVLLR